VTVATSTRALRVGPPALLQKVDQQLRDRHANANPVLLVRGEPSWPHEPVQTTPGGRRLRVVPAASVLAVWEQVTAPREETLVLLTSLSQEELGPGVLSQVFRQRILDVEPWDLVGESFGATHLDPRLRTYAWAGEALIDATPAAGWPRLAGTVLGPDVALRCLAWQRLGLGRLGLEPEDVDAAALLRWSALPGAGAVVADLPAAERDGLAGWLAGTFGRPVALLFALLNAGHLTDALPLGLVCAALWAPDSDHARAQGRVEQYFGSAHRNDGDVRSFGNIATDVVVDLLQRAGQAPERQQAETILDRAEQLLLGFDVVAAGQSSPVLRSGFEHRLSVAGRALRHAAEQPSEETLAVLENTVAAVGEHHLSDMNSHRVRRLCMAQRLAQWLADAQLPGSVGITEFIAHQVGQWSWVDRAQAHLWLGEDTNAALAEAYHGVYAHVQARRDGADKAFAARLAAWSSHSTSTDTPLSVERVLERVVAPAALDRGRSVLLIVLDGLTAADATEIAEEMAEARWVEYDPMAGHGDTATRRGAVTVLPTMTGTSRTSLLTGSLRQGDQDDERRTFEAHPLWRGRPARLFHKNGVHGGAGDVLSDDLVAALEEPDTVVGVVINTVDDALHHGRQSADAGWRIAQVGALRALLDRAQYHGRAVIIASDHGHVLERNGHRVAAAEGCETRYRTDPAPAGEGEVELAGSRVLAPEHRIVALWSTGMRYSARFDGYHGGASLAEVVVPVLAFLPLFAPTMPPGWAPLGDPHPSWWLTRTAPARPPERPSPAPPVPRKRRDTAPPAGTQALFDVPAGAPAAPSLLDALLASEMFAAQHALTPRKVPTDKVRKAMAALLEVGGILPIVIVADRAGEQPARAAGFLTVLQRIFNVDNYPVLSVTDAGRTVRLDIALLREQFDLPKSAR
jgi:hypothetical protein